MMTDTELELFDIKQERERLYREIHYLKRKIDHQREHLKGLEGKNRTLKQLLRDAPQLELQVRDLTLELSKRDFLIAELRSR